MEGFHFEMKTTREDFSKNIGKQLAELVDAGLNDNVMGVAITFVEDGALACGYVGDRDKYLETAAETFVTALARMNDCEQDETAVRDIRGKVQVLCAKVLIGDFLKQLLNKE